MVDFYIYVSQSLELLSFYKRKEKDIKKLSVGKRVVAKKRDTLPQFGTDPSQCFYDQESKSKVDIHLNV